MSPKNVQLYSDLAEKIAEDHGTDTDLALRRLLVLLIKATEDNSMALAQAALEIARFPYRTGAKVANDG